MKHLDAIAERIAATTGRPFDHQSTQSLGGGCINAAYSLSDGEQTFFVKQNSADRLDMFEAEAAGLDEIARTGTIRVPEPVCTGQVGSVSYIVMEYVAFGGRGDARQAGQALADMHRATRDRFGWDRNNTIGSTPQLNRQCDDWIEFWRDRRLGYQLELAARNGYGLEREGERLLGRLSDLIDHAPAPSLLHGDLWGGNLGYDRVGSPVIYDPAVYYGDREADLAMTELFGGFGGDFYAAYNDAWRLDAGYSVRKVLYNLYHILNHLNLFGGGYLGQAQNMMRRLLAEVS